MKEKILESVRPYPGFNPIDDTDFGSLMRHEKAHCVMNRESVPSLMRLIVRFMGKKTKQKFANRSICRQIRNCFYSGLAR